MRTNAHGVSFQRRRKMVQFPESRLVGMPWLPKLIHSCVALALKDKQRSK